MCLIRPRGRMFHPTGPHHASSRLFGTTSKPQNSFFFLGRPTMLPDKKFKCMKCDKSYKHKPNLYRHSKYECDGVPRFVCEICGKAYTQKVTLKQHVDSLHLTAVFKFDNIFRGYRPKREDFDPSGAS